MLLSPKHILYFNDFISRNTVEQNLEISFVFLRFAQRFHTFFHRVELFQRNMQQWSLRWLPILFDNNHLIHIPFWLYPRWQIIFMQYFVLFQNFLYCFVHFLISLTQSINIIITSQLKDFNIHRGFIHHFFWFSYSDVRIFHSAWSTVLIKVVMIPWKISTFGISSIILYHWLVWNMTGRPQENIKSSVSKHQIWRIGVVFNSILHLELPEMTFGLNQYLNAALTHHLQQL